MKIELVPGTTIDFDLTECPDDFLKAMRDRCRVEKDVDVSREALHESRAVEIEAELSSRRVVSDRELSR